MATWLLVRAGSPAPRVLTSMRSAPRVHRGTKLDIVRGSTARPRRTRGRPKTRLEGAVNARWSRGIKQLRPGSRCGLLFHKTGLVCGALVFGGEARDEDFVSHADWRPFRPRDRSVMHGAFGDDAWAHMLDAHGLGDVLLRRGSSGFI